MADIKTNLQRLYDFIDKDFPKSLVDCIEQHDLRRAAFTRYPERYLCLLLSKKANTENDKKFALVKAQQLVTQIK